MKHTKFLKGLGALALVLGTLLPTLLGVSAVSAPNVADETTQRTLNIVPKDSPKVTPSDKQLNFEQDGDADNLPAPDVASKHFFKITRLMPSGTGNIIPADKATYKVDESSTPVVVIGEDGASSLEFTLPTPSAISGGTRTISSTAKVLSDPADKDSALYEKDSAQAQDLLQQCFEGTAKADDTADGYYQIEEVFGSGLAWATVVSIPTFKATKVDSDATDASNINYEVYVYPKVSAPEAPQFDSYVDVVRLVGTGTSTANVRLTTPGVDWTTRSINKGSVHTFTGTLLLNGWDEFTPNLPGTGYPAILMTFADREASGPATDVQKTAANLPAYCFAQPKVTVPLTANKTFAFSNEIELGLIIEDKSNPANNQYVSLFRTADGSTEMKRWDITVGQTTNDYLSGLEAYRLSGTNANSYSSVLSAATKGMGLRTGHISTMLTRLATDIKAGVDKGGVLFSKYAGLDFPGVTDVYAASSPLRIRLAVSTNQTVAGTAFKAGESEESKPFFYGSTVGERAGSTDGSTTAAAILNDYSFFSFGVTPGAGTYAGKEFKENYIEKAKVTTGAINLLKTDNYAQPLAGAKFAVKDSTGNYAGTYTAADGFGGWSTSKPTASATGVLTSDATGKVSFDGLAVDGSDYTVEEIAAPTGYKTLATADSPLIKATQLSYDEQAEEGDITKVINVPLLALPNTGGRGLWLLLALSATVLAGGYFIRRNGTRRNA